ncbi:MAG: hypothetical protein K9M97_08130 [Akkermansiaceae bacterium]|nr:hypothetical protein [Akkermansiaceae bacterium]
MKTSETRERVIDILASLHHVPFHVNYLPTQIGSSCGKANRLPDFETFSLEAKGDDICIRPKAGIEWRDVLLEASIEKMGSEELPLTPNARCLLDWLRCPGNSPVSIKVNILGKKAGFRGSGSYSLWEDYCREIDLKTSYHIRTGRERGSWGGSVIELTLEEKSENNPTTGSDSPNPHFAFDPTVITKAACDAFARTVETTVMESKDPDPGLDLIVYDVATRRTLEQAWPASLEKSKVSAFELERFLRKVRLAPCLMLVWSIPYHGDRWLVGCRPTKGTDWSGIRKELIEWRAFKGSRETYGVGERTGLVLDWLLSLRPDQFTIRLSPPVSAAWEDEIGFKPEYDGKTRQLLLEAMADEINEQTPFEIRVLSSADASYHQSDCRLLFKRKPTSEEVLVRQIRHFLLDHAILASEAMVREWLTGLTGRHDP